LCRNCLLQQVIDGKIKGEIEETGRRERRLGSYWMTLRKGEGIHF
jgi:hypothetical protein